MKALIAFLLTFVICRCSAQGILEDLQLNNTVELDADGGSFRLDWDFVYDLPDNPEMVLEMVVATRGWFSLRFTSEDLKKGDYFFGAYNGAVPSQSFFLDKHCSLKNGTGCERPDGPSDDIRNDFKLVTISYGANYTLVRLARRANTGDIQDVPITVLYNNSLFLFLFFCYNEL